MYLYDQLQCVAAPLLALSAATPILNGFLVDSCTRFEAMAIATDDRHKDDP